MERWTESRLDCLQRGADLVIIESKEEQEFIRNNTQGTTWRTWIGLRYSESKWLWVDGTAPMEQLQRPREKSWRGSCACFHGDASCTESCLFTKPWICETGALLPFRF
ncbi:hypothetical protein JZ751_015814 [Albula glossodonta]|uniref:C-type lectin domain-containing protein n=1 Tax=Albula glossodonta TaxID=121402 RepID=A0A8T2MY66_9TELE|nr:hypothetical protein JZ751_015814 [Albula glossodonta]